ncbi:MAG: glycosyltransferase family 4 protein [Desulfurococcaceae archaeon]
MTGLKKTTKTLKILPGSKLKIVILSQLFPPDLGGSSTRAYNLAKALQLNNVDVLVVAAFPHYPSGHVPRHLKRRALAYDNVDGINVIRTWVAPLESKGVVNRLVLFLSFILSATFALPFVRKADVIFASNPQLLCIFPALLYKVVLRSPIILNVDDLWPEDPVDLGLIKSKLFKKLAEAVARFAYRMADVVTPISPGYVDVIRGKYGVPVDRIVVIPAGVDVSRFHLKNAFKRDRNFRVLYTGAFSPAYDFNQVLRAARLLEHHKDILFVLQGKGELVESIKTKVSAMRLTNVIVIDEVLSRDDVAKLMSEADVLLLPLRDFGRPYLGLSTKIYEYQAAGKTIVCCAYGTPAEYIAKTKSGLVVKPGDYKSIADAILKLKNDKRVSEQFGLHAYKAATEVSLEKIGKKIKDIVMNLKRHD